MDTSIHPKRTILIVDDHPITVDSYQSLLATIESNKQANYLVAFTCEQAYNTINSNHLENQPIHYAFIDISLPAYKEKIIEHNLAEDAEFIKEEETYREYLSEKELEILWNTDCDFPKLKHMAFISTLTGLRFIDVITLPFCNVYSDIHQGNSVPVRPLQMIGRHLRRLGMGRDHAIRRGDLVVSCGDKAGVAVVRIG